MEFRLVIWPFAVNHDRRAVLVLTYLSAICAPPTKATRSLSGRAAELDWTLSMVLVEFSIFAISAHISFAFSGKG